MNLWNHSNASIPDVQRRMEAGIKSEMRRAVRKYNYLKTPLSGLKLDPTRSASAPRFLLPLESDHAFPKGAGLRLNTQTVNYPDERLEDVVYDFARCIWHLRDWTRQWLQVAGLEQDFPSASVPGWREVLIARDLITKKKHAIINNPESDCDPWLDLVRLDVSKGNPVEVWYSGADRQMTVMLSQQIDVPFSIGICRGDGSGCLYQRRDREEPVRIGDAADVLMRAMYFWFNWVVANGILNQNDPESQSLLRLHAEILLRRDQILERLGGSDHI